jgi:AcrR family transcriptional regulator
MERKRIGNRGRPRSDEAHTAILSAAIAECRDVGYDALAIDAVAARAGVGKATVYRRWASKEELIGEALAGLLATIPERDSGSLEADLEAMMLDTLGLYRDPATLNLLSGLVAAMARSERIATAVRAGMVSARRAAGMRILARARARGDVPADLDAELTLDLLDGALLHRVLLTGAPIDATLTRDAVAIILGGIRARPVLP